jgi:outer membrane immunogenic protein
LTVAGGLPGPGTTGVFTDDRWGYAVGAGIEYGFAPNWSGKIEYMHFGFDTSNSAPGSLSGAPIALSLRIDTVKVGINYRFNGPVVARY